MCVQHQDLDLHYPDPPFFPCDHANFDPDVIENICFPDYFMRCEVQFIRPYRENIKARNNIENGPNALPLISTEIWTRIVFVERQRTRNSGKREN